MFHFDTPCVFTWPGTWRKVAHEVDYFELAKLAVPSLVPFTDIDKDTGCTLTWKSYWWQVLNFPKAKLSPGIRGFRLDPKTQKFKVMVGRMVGFTCMRSELDQFCPWWKISLAGCTSFIQVLFRMVQGVLKCSDGETMTIISQRLASMDLRASYLPSLLEIDEAISLFDKHDVQQILQAQQQGEVSLDEQKEFTDSYRKMREVVREKAKEKIKLQKVLNFPDGITTQEEACPYIPPGCSIWRGLERSEWCGHCPPRRRVQFCWSEYSEKGALKETLRKLWHQWLELYGLQTPECPIHGLF